LTVYTRNVFDFISYSLSIDVVHLNWKDIIAGIIITNALCYLLLIAKIYLWDCRRAQILMKQSLDSIKAKVIK